MLSPVRWAWKTRKINPHKIMIDLQIIYSIYAHHNYVQGNIGCSYIRFHSVNLNYLCTSLPFIYINLLVFVSTQFEFVIPKGKKENMTPL